MQKFLDSYAENQEAESKQVDEVEDKIIVQPDWNSSTDRDIDFKRTYKKTYYNYALKYVINEVNSNREKRKGNYLSAFKMKTKSIIAQTGMNFLK